MNKFKRNERIAAITQILVNAPNKVFTLTCFTEIFAASKSTISEDLVIVKDIFEKQKLGKIETITGAAGGVKYIPIISLEKKSEIIENLKNELSKESRRIPGGFLYLADILYDPSFVQELGAIFAEEFYSKEVDYVVTVETKGIPLALKTAHMLNVPLVVFRNTFKADDGPTLSIHYASGSDGRLKTMYAPKNAMKKGSNVLIIDDFMRAGGTIQGMISLVDELESTVIGIGVLFEEVMETEKLVDDYFSLFTIDPRKETGHVTIQSHILK
ncbi:pur operon repressor [Acidaminobacter sp. JC074]|uniref:pur operon repressor n=1 Tax=Acidaminobacter sp. JC074 TaxID=2530199 RepID=UPI001F102BE3